MFFFFLNGLFLSHLINSKHVFWDCIIYAVMWGASCVKDCLGRVFLSPLFLIQESDLKMSSPVKVCLGSSVTLVER